jgi:hypothetical protein
MLLSCHALNSRYRLCPSSSVENKNSWGVSAGTATASLADTDGAASVVSSTSQSVPARRFSASDVGERQDATNGRHPGTHPDYEIDHLIPLCLGGSDDFSNLWPQPRRSIEPICNAEAKDRLERRLCDMVCAGQIDLGAAQEDIAKDLDCCLSQILRGPLTD